MLALLLMAATTVQDAPIVVVDRDNVVITESCRVQIAAAHIADADGNGVIQIEGDGVIVDLADSRLHGAPNAVSPDEYDGVGVRITGSSVTVLNGRLSGFKVGVYATGTDGLTIDGLSLTDNFRQRLKSTPHAENAADWLSPHRNDHNEWADRYGAGIWIEDSENVTVRNVTAREGQNGIILDRVTGAKVYDNDCSFLSGWGLAMWRTSDSIVSRNAFDFCIRGYSHGVYNRGQDSAGILMFEQCSNNVIAENSATHGGDGIFAFAGSEALGDVESPNEPAWHAGRGNNGNLFVGNDLSYAAAHGLELTFSFDNTIIDNRFAENAICGIWGGYSQNLHIARNEFIRNGEEGYGLERGGVNIEHGSDNFITDNQFTGNQCGVHLWWDNDEHLLSLPWAEQNGAKAENNYVVDNQFSQDVVAVHLRETIGTRVYENSFDQVETRVRDENARPHRAPLPGARSNVVVPTVEVLGEKEPIGARSILAGRRNIIMTEWGPHDWTTPRYAQPSHSIDDNGRTRITYQYLPALLSEGYQPPYTTFNVDPKNVEAEWVKMSDQEPAAKSLQLTALNPGVHLVSFQWGLDSEDLHDLSTTLVSTQWTVRHFRSVVDPREEYEQWKRTGERDRAKRLPALDFAWGSDGPDHRIGADHFGTIATTRIPMPRGEWRIETVSDDGIRVWVDDELLIDDWTHHAPTPHGQIFFVSSDRDVTIRVEHFELDGHAELSVKLNRAE